MQGLGIKVDKQKAFNGHGKIELGISKEKPFETAGQSMDNIEADSKEEQRAIAQSRRCQQVAECLKQFCSSNLPDLKTQERRNM